MKSLLAVGWLAAGPSEGPPTTRPSTEGEEAPERAETPYDIREMPAYSSRKDDQRMLLIAAAEPDQAANFRALVAVAIVAAACYPMVFATERGSCRSRVANI